MNFYETTVIGGIVNGAARPSDIALSPSDFSETDLGNLLAIARDMEASGEPLTAETLYMRFAEGGGGWVSVSDLNGYGAKATTASVALAVSHIQERALGELLRSKAEQMIEGKLSGGRLLDLFREAVREGEAQYSTVSNDFEWASETVGKQIALYEDLHYGKTVAIPTGFDSLDRHLLDGFSKGDEHIIVGITGAGKSAFALNCALHQAKAGYTVGYVSREMSTAENLMRIQSADAQIPRWKIRKNMDKNLLSDLRHNLESLKPLKLVFNTKTQDIESLRLQTKALAESKGLDILYVDYLQLMKSAASHSSRANEVQMISRTLKELAMELNIPVVSLCQFNRGATGAAITEVMFYLKESSGIEQDASTITVIQTEKPDEHSNGFPDAKAIIVKNRNGATFKPIHFKFDGETFRFLEVAAMAEAYDGRF